jgi:hypothetical protein
MVYLLLDASQYRTLSEIPKNGIVKIEFSTRNIALAAK